MRKGGCPVCGSANRAFYCPICVNKQVFSNEEQRVPIDQLRQQRNALLATLNKLLANKAAVQQQQLHRWRQEQELKVAQAKAQQAKNALAEAQQQLSQLTSSNNNRRATLEQLSQQTAAARSKVLGNTLPTVLRYQSLTLSHVSAMLAREQRLRLRELMEILPLRVNAVRSSGGPIQITICNVRLPESATAPSGGWPEPQSTSAALGYLLLFIDKVALIMGGPMLHESAYQASTSSIWQPNSFWNRQPASPAAMLPLHVMSAGLGSGSAAGQAAYNSTTSRYLATANFWGLPRSDSGGAGGIAAAAGAAAYAGAAAAAAAFTRATGIEGYSSSTAVQQAAASSSTPQQSGSSSSGSTSLSGAPSSSSRRESDFKAAWDFIQRSLACLLKDKAARNGMQLANTWNPVAWLAVYCAVVKRDSRQDGKLVAASFRAADAAAGASNSLDGILPFKDGTMSGLGSAIVGGAGADSRRVSTGIDDLDLDDEEEDEGWGFVQAPFLPPPPSQPDEVEHWTRAMFTDGNALAGAGSSTQTGHGLGLGIPRGLGAAAAAAGYGAAGVGGSLGRLAGPSGGVTLGSSPSYGGMVPIERIESLFGR